MHIRHLQNRHNMSRVIIIGGGAAGMMAAISAAQDGQDVLLIEKNEKLGKKLFITGKGRCNLTNACETDEFFANILSGRKFLYSSYYGFTNEDTMRWFEEHGLKIKTERGDRVFPQSDHSSDVIRTLEKALRNDHLSVSIRLNTEVSEIMSEQNVITGVRLKDGTVLGADAVIIATGGCSYPSCGSTGDGYRFAEKKGHKLIKRQPALVPLTVSQEWIPSLQGLSLRNVSVTLTCVNKRIYEGFGEMLFTHFGVSGPLILSASSYIREEMYQQDLKLSIDLKPALSEQQLDERIQRDFTENMNKQFKNSLNKLLPTKLIPVIIRLCGIGEDRQVNQITRQERTGLVHLLKHMELTIIGTRGFSEAIITRGGVTLKEVNPSTMESKLVKGLFFAGEVLDLDALTGGFNLQIAWSTGYAAGKGVSTWK